MHELTLQIFNAGFWTDVMSLAFNDPEKGLLSPCRAVYKTRYVVEACLESSAQAVSARLPVSFDLFSSPTAPAFLQDIVPSGAAKRFLVSHMRGKKPQGLSGDLYLLQRSTPAPIGNLRIKESLDALDDGEPMGFRRIDVITRDQRFLEYAYEQSAAIGSATGAGGEAPKLLMTQAADGLLYPDATVTDEQAWWRTTCAAT